MDRAESLSFEKLGRGCWVIGLLEEEDKGQSWYLEKEEEEDEEDVIC